MKKTKITTYFITDEKEFDRDRFLIFIFESVYFTILPCIGVWAFFQTNIIWFLLMFIFPLFLRVRLKKKTFQKKELKFRGK